MSVRHRDLPTGGAPPRPLERNHVTIVAVRSPPNLEIEIGKYDRFVVSDTKHMKIGDAGQGSMVIDRIGHGRIMIAGQQHHRQQGPCNHCRGAIEQLGRQAVRIEGISGKQDDVGCRIHRRGHYGGEAGGAVAAMQPRGIVVIEVQIGAVNHHEVAAPRKRRLQNGTGHGGHTSNGSRREPDGTGT